ncbi:MAG: Diguanylate phosphodiesterase [Frankiales bacterium]|nr:Diguanylate phosphodiesterase [Frankiales bacterium]
MAAEPGRGPRWALPPRPPEQWVPRVWSLLAVGAVLVAVGAQLPHRDDLPGTVVDVVAALAALAAGYALLVEHAVREQARLRWAAGGFGVAYTLLVVHALVPADSRASVLHVALAAVPLYALTSPLAGRQPWLVALPALPLAAAATGRRDVLPAVAVIGLAVAGLVVWRRRDRPGIWVSLALVLTAVVVLLDRYEAAPFVLAALGSGTGALWGFGRQSRRWRQLETDVRQLRSASPLLPGRSVTPDDDEGLPSRGELRVLIDSARLQVAVQPVVELATGTVVGHEALSRFGGRVPTDRWFKAASLHGLGGELERVTLRAAIALLPGMPEQEFLAVNVSPAALSDPEVVRLLEGTDLRRVVVEITEHEAVADYDRARATLGRLRGAGARIAVDDTGAGFASLRHVLMLQPDLIKLDTSLTRGIEHDERQQDLVRAVTVFAAQVGAVVLAEGIETQGQLSELTDIGVELGQGWHLGVPVLT